MAIITIAVADMERIKQARTAELFDILLDAMEDKMTRELPETNEVGCDSFEGLVFKPYTPIMSAIPLNTLTEEQYKFVTNVFPVTFTESGVTHLTISTLTETSWRMNGIPCGSFECSFNDVFVMA